MYYSTVVVYDSEMSLQVLVIGAGAAGLCAARHLLRHGGAHFAPPVVVEMGENVGGRSGAGPVGREWCARYSSRL